jgi:hypothetical protein
MSLTCVNMSEDVWLTCLTHALSTETEEIMGLLLGDIEVHTISSSSLRLRFTFTLQRMFHLTWIRYYSNLIEFSPKVWLFAALFLMIF